MEYEQKRIIVKRYATIFIFEIRSKRWTLVTITITPMFIALLKGKKTTVV